jgi:hypothetical protein
MSEWSDDVLANRPGWDRRSLLKGALVDVRAAAGSPRVRPNGDISQTAALALKADTDDGQEIDAIAGIRHALQARGLVLAGTFRAPVHLTAQYRDPRAYQAYVEEMVCLP